LVADEDAKLLEVARFPVAKVTFLNRYASGNPPAKFRLVYEPDVDVKETLLKFVLDPLHDFASQSAILATRNELMRGEVGRLFLSHGRRPPFLGVPRDPLTPLLDSLAVS
jgi:hypothetical protein